MGVSNVELLAAYPQHNFINSDEFLFDAADDIIYYSEPELSKQRGKVALLHEVAHAELGHFDYSTDIELVIMECRAWQRTRQLASQHDIRCDEHFIRDCLSGYSEWLEERASCPNCQSFSLQTHDVYQCFRCQLRWRVRLNALDQTHKEKL